ncbi:hypothetical protein [Brevibacillus brevis]|uniref:hypothetical protein n=1 Tax=Brevibacillus brevis TaxID=1393 RepID=UPI001EDB6DB1|nr:hypothetical protein [Brevibacillus brevis]UKL00664.1 hypothetical protein FO446_26080 [Brevibacillus brevis]
MEKEKLLGWNIFTLSICITLAAVTSLIFIHVNSLSAEETFITQEKKTYMRDKRSKEINDMLEQSWQNAINTFALNMDGLEKFDWFDSDHITMNLQEPESTYFSEDLTNALNSVRKPGDLVPLVLTTSNLSEVYILFQREEGNGNFVKMKLVSYVKKEKINQDQRNPRNWVISSIEEKYPSR